MTEVDGWETLAPGGDECQKEWFMGLLKRVFFTEAIVQPLA